jgi:hypothetical protein
MQTTVQTRSQMSHQQQLQSQHHRQQRPRPIIIAAYHRQPTIPTSPTQPPPTTATITVSLILTLIYHTNTTINIIQIQILTRSVARVIMQTTTITGRINSTTIVVIV